MKIPQKITIRTEKPPKVAIITEIPPKDTPEE
jgi:hypothetical protein